MKTLYKTIFFALICYSFSACSYLRAKPKPVIKEVVVVETYIKSKPAPVPEGVQAYCWEEPMMDEENIKPGLDYDGKWYRPKHKALRQVRQGKWRPCKVEK